MVTLDSTQTVKNQFEHVKHDLSSLYNCFNGCKLFNAAGLILREKEVIKLWFIATNANDTSTQQEQADMRKKIILAIDRYIKTLIEEKTFRIKVKIFYFSKYFVFSVKLKSNKCSLNCQTTENKTSVLRGRKWPLCKLYNSHYGAVVVVVRDGPNSNPTKVYSFYSE